jgi:hypothetical protein
MVAIEVYDHLVVDELGDTAGGLPIEAEPDVGLKVIVVRVVNDDVSPALEAIFYELFDAGQLFFGELEDILAQFFSALIEIGIKILGLIVFPLEFLELKPVFAKLYGIDLGRSSRRKK